MTRRRLGALSRSEAAAAGWVMRRATLDASFWDRMDRSGGPDACWPWTSARQSLGYGYFTRDYGKVTYAHRHALELTLGRSLGSGLVAMHLCDNPPCCNPAHLREGTRSENQQDMIAKGRGRGQFTEAAL